MGNNLLDRLRANDKKKLFSASQNSIAYPTGFLPFDYRNGELVEIRDENNKVVEFRPSIGLVGGTFTTIIGKSGTAKTTWAVQSAYNIVRPFADNAFVIHYDLEQATSYTRVRNITGASTDDLSNKYVLRQEKNFLEDIFDSIMAIGKEKESDPKAYKYGTGVKDVFNNEIKAYVPTVIIIDSLPSLASKDLDEEEMKGQTEAMRMAQKVKQFYKKLMPVIKTYNISVMVINHINVKVEMNAFTKTQAQVNYLKQDEALPGGNSPIYYANNLIKFVSSTKFKEEDDGFNGFMVRAELIKSRTNQAGQFVNMIYNQLTGFDPILTLFQYADDMGMLDGRNPYKYFKGYNEIKFDSRKFKTAFLEREEVRKALYESTHLLLESMLSSVTKDEENPINENEILMTLYRE